MHVGRAERHAVTGIEVVADAGADHESEGEVLSLRVRDAVGTFCVDEARAAAQLEVRRGSPIAVDEVAPHAEVESSIYFFRAPGNGGQREGSGEVGIAAQDPGAANLAHVPSQGRKDGYQGVVQRLLRVIAAYERIEDKRKIDGKSSRFEGELELVAVIDVIVEIDNGPGSANLYNRIRRCSGRILARGQSRLGETGQQKGKELQVSYGHLNK